VMPTARNETDAVTAKLGILVITLLPSFSSGSVHGRFTKQRTL
jgi:hypothetical protein